MDTLTTLEKRDMAFWAMKSINQWHCDVQDGTVKASEREIAAKSQLFETYKAAFEKYSRAAATEQLEKLGASE